MEHGHLPELKRVIAAYGEHTVMKKTLAEALAADVSRRPSRWRPLSFIRSDIVLWDRGTVVE